jgi:LPS-assembly lipoprotein
MSWSRRTLVLALAGGSLAACGFEPLYRQPTPGSGAVARLAEVSVPEKLDRTYQLFRNEFLARARPRGSSGGERYRLDLIVTESLGAVLVTRSEDVTRYNLALTVNYRLFQSGTDRIAATGSVGSLANFNALRAEFANIASETDARERAARDAADQLVARLALLFERNPAP